LHDNTNGAAAVGNEGGNAVVLVEWETEATEALVTTLTADVDGAGELRVNPTAKPMPRAARTAAAIPARWTVLRRMVITPIFFCPDEGDGDRGTARALEFPRRRCEWANPRPLTALALGGFRDLRGVATAWRRRELRRDTLNSHPTQNLAVTLPPEQGRRSWSLSSGGRSKAWFLESSRWS
jgi:hypothetical protein